MDPEKTKTSLVQIEAAAQEVLITKDELVELDFRRQKTREALRALKNNIGSLEKTWMSFGGMFVKMTTKKAMNLLERDMINIDQEISSHREQLKEQVKKLRDLEGKPELKGFDLTPITKEAEVILQAISK